MCSGSSNLATRHRFLLLAPVLLLPELALAQTSPFLTGATAQHSNLLAWLTPIAIIIVLDAGGFAMAGRVSWGWFIGLVIGIPVVVGAPQIVD